MRSPAAQATSFSVANSTDYVDYNLREGVRRATSQDAYRDVRSHVHVLLDASEDLVDVIDRVCDPLYPKHF
jgi:hypothetical protein